jgi:hypothetical protein
VKPETNKFKQLLAERAARNQPPAPVQQAPLSHQAPQTAIHPSPQLPVRPKISLPPVPVPNPKLQPSNIPLRPMPPVVIPTPPSPSLATVPRSRTVDLRAVAQQKSQVQQQEVQNRILVPKPITSHTSTPLTSPAQPMTAPVTIPPKNSQTNVNININLPTLHRPKILKRPALPALPYKKISIISGSVLLVAMLGIGGMHEIESHISKNKLAAARLNLKDASSVQLSKPSFTPVVPSNQPQLASTATAGSTAAAFDGTKDTYSYTDGFLGTPVTISQQPLPTTLGTPAQAIATVAKTVNATTPIPTNAGTAYMSTNTKTGAQTVVYTENNLLIFIQAGFTHPNSDWTTFLNNLK